MAFPSFSPLQKLLVTVNLLAVTALFASILFIFFRPEVSKRTFESASLPNVSPTPTPIPTPSPEPGFTLLLMGRAGANHDGGALTDTILLARVMDSTKSVLLLSIPRDLWVTLPKESGEGTMSGKINSAYAAGGGTLSKIIISDVTGLSVDKYITLDFSGFEQAIDSIGGIDLTIANAFTDYEYPITGRESVECALPVPPSSSPSPESSPSPSPTPSTTPLSEEELINSGKLDPSKLTGLPAKYPCRYEMLHFDAGTQHMDGVTALKFVRSRHSSEEGNDFSRGRRQQQLLEAVAQKLFSLNAVTKIPTFFATLKGHIDTDMNAGDWVSLLPRANQIRAYTTIQAALTTDNYLSQGYTADHQFALTPLAGLSSYEAIHNWIASIITPTIPLKYPVIQIESKTKLPLTDSFILPLTQARFPVHTAIVTTKEATTSATLKIVNPNIDPKTLETIHSFTGIKGETTLTEKQRKNYPNIDLRIILP